MGRRRCKQRSWNEVDKRFYCDNCETFNIKQEHQIAKQELRQDKFFSTRMPYANKKIELYKTKEVMINKIQKIKGRTKLN